MDRLEAGFNWARSQAGSDVRVNGRLLRRWLLAAILASQVAALPAAVTTSYAGTLAPLGMNCGDLVSPDGVSYTFCTGKVPTFDGVPLDVDLSVPQGQIQAHLPLLVMVGGGDNHKTEWESATVRNSSNHAADGYNNVAFAQLGYAVLTYSSRGAFGSCSPFGDPAANPPEPPDSSVLSPTGVCRNARVGMPDRRVEVHDLKYLASLLVDAGVADPARIGITGFSAGGATALLAGLEDDLVTMPDGSTGPWTSPGGIQLAVAAAVPYVGYTDVINVMAPNGRAGDNIFAPDGDRLRPVGIPELFLDAGVPMEIAGNAMMVAPANPSAGTDAFFRIASQYLVGEPFTQNPALTDDGQQLVKWKSAYYQNDLIARAATRSHRVPFFFVYGWTDELVPPIEASSLVAKLRAADPTWPINIALADIGHTGQNKLSDWDPIHQQLRAFLDQHLRNGSGAAIAPVSARVTTCDTTVGASVQANSLTQLAPGRRVFFSTSIQRTSWAPPAQTANNPFGCTPVPADPGAPGWSWSVSEPVTIRGLPLVGLVFRVTGTDADVMVRLWDVDPSVGQRVLITRGGYKYHGTGGISVASFALMGNAWVVPAGHTLQLEVAQTDTPLFAPDKLSAAFEYDLVLLGLPTP